jgi:hypothetical protein
MALELHPAHPELGAWRATHPTDPSVARHLTVVKVGLWITGTLVVIAFPLLAASHPYFIPVALGVGAVVGFGFLASQPTGKVIIPLWSWQAFGRKTLRIEVYANGFVVADSRRTSAFPWEVILALRHPLFRHGNWSRDEDASHYAQQASRLVVDLPQGDRLLIDDFLEHHQELAEEFQREVYPRLVRLGQEVYEDGYVVWFGPLGISRQGIHGDEGLLPWPEVGALELKGTRLRVMRASWHTTFLAADATDLPNFPVLMALLERDQPDRARDLLDGLPLDSAAHLWQRASRLREQPPRRAPADSSLPSEREKQRDEVPDHSGRPFRSDADLFVPPPPEIGLLISAGTTLTHGVKPYRVETRLLASLLAASVALLPGFALVLLFSWRHPILLGLGFGLLPAVVVLLVWICTRFSHQVTYVGTRGLARYSCLGRRDHLMKEELLLFEEAASVHTSLTHRYTKNGYQGSDYSSTWSTAGGRKLFSISGTYHSEKEPPPAQDLFHFGESADVAWSLHLLDTLQERLEGEGVEFYLQDRDSIRVRPGLLRFRLGGHQSECLIEDLGETSLKGGVLKLRRHDAQVGWFSSTGVYEVKLAQLGNARLFLFLLRTVVAFGSTRATEHWRPSPSLEKLDQIVSKPLQHDPRATAFVRKVLNPEAASRALNHLEGVRSGLR